LSDVRTITVAVPQYKLPIGRFDLANKKKAMHSEKEETPAMESKMHSKKFLQDAVKAKAKKDKKKGK
jgi:hypothetical protein